MTEWIRECQRLDVFVNDSATRHIYKRRGSACQLATFAAHQRAFYGFDDYNPVPATIDQWPKAFLAAVYRAQVMYAEGRAKGDEPIPIKSLKPCLYHEHSTDSAERKVCWASLDKQNER